MNIWKLNVLPVEIPHLNCRMNLNSSEAHIQLIQRGRWMTCQFISILLFSNSVAEFDRTNGFYIAQIRSTLEFNSQYILFSIYFQKYSLQQYQFVYMCYNFTYFIVHSSAFSHELTICRGKNSINNWLNSIKTLVVSFAALHSVVLVSRRPQHVFTAGVAIALTHPHLRAASQCERSALRFQLTYESNIRRERTHARTHCVSWMRQYWRYIVLRTHFA